MTSRELIPLSGTSRKRDNVRTLGPRVRTWLQGRRADRAVTIVLPEPQTVRTCGFEAEVAIATALVAQVRTNVLELDSGSAKELHQLRVDLNRVGLAIDSVAMQLQETSEPTPELVARVSKLAVATRDVARLASIFTISAAEQIDDEARFQAGLAADAAGVVNEAAISASGIASTFG